MCVLVLFPVLVYSVRQRSLLFLLPCLSKTSWSRGQTGVDLKLSFCTDFRCNKCPNEIYLLLCSYSGYSVGMTEQVRLKLETDQVG